MDSKEEFLLFYGMILIVRFVQETQDINLEDPKSNRSLKESNRRIRFVDDIPIIKSSQFSRRLKGVGIGSISLSLGYSIYL